MRDDITIAAGDPLLQNPLTLEWKPLSFVRERHLVRPINLRHLNTVKAKMQALGFLAAHPLCVTPDGDQAAIHLVAGQSRRFRAEERLHALSGLRHSVRQAGCRAHLELSGRAGRLQVQPFPICGGKERLVDGKKATLHPTQKPEAVIRHLMELITVPGDVVLDGFMGVGTTAKVARNLGRKFIGFELDPVYFAAAQHRLSGEGEAQMDTSHVAGRLGA